jgi:glutaredoxin
MTLVVCAILLAIPNGLTAAELYKWTDDRGRVYFSDRAPPGQDAEKLDYGTKDRRASKRALARDPDKKVIMYTSSHCPLCTQAREHMDSAGIHYEEYDIHKTPRGRRDYKKMKGRTVPILMVGEQRMNGFYTSKLNQMLAAAPED